MYNQDDFLNLLNSLSEQDLKNVLSDIKFSEHNKIYYVVDTYDIVNYTLPFVDSNISLRNRGNFSQHTIAYETIFSNDRFNFSLLDEYKEELVSISNSLSSKLKNFQKTKERFFKLLMNENSLEGEDKNDIKLFVRDNIETFTVLYIFLEHGTNVYDRFNELLSKRLNIESFKSNDSILDEFINQKFKECRKTNFTDKMFDLFVEKYFINLSSFKSEFDKYCYLENTYRDIAVIDRVININKIIASKNICFHYLSSAPMKTNKIFDIIGKNYEDENYRVNRNIMQLYLINFLSGSKYTKEECSIFIKSLIELKNISVEKKQLVFTSDNQFVISIFNSILDKFNKDKKALENKFFYKIYLKYRSKFENAINNGIANNLEFTSYLNNFDEKLKTEFRNTPFETKINLTEIENIKQTYYLGKKFISESKSENTIRIPLGQDYIRNSFQHLPMLFYFNNTDNINKLHIYYKFLNELSNYSHNEIIEIKEFENYLSSVLKNNLPYEIQYLVLTCLNLIVSKKDETISFSEIDVIESLEKFKKIKSYSHSEFVVERKDMSNLNKLKFEKKANSIDQEIDYILLWLYRRQKNYSKAKSLYKNYSQTNDPRFFHGIGLVLLSEGYEHIEIDSSSIEVFINSIVYLEKALNLYINVEAETFDINLKQLLIKQKLAILNSIINANLQIISVELVNRSFNQTLLSRQRVIMDYIKFELDKSLPQISYNRFDTFNHTESLLEYYEALFLIEQNKFNEALIKISYCTKRAYSFRESKYLKKDRYREVMELANSARLKILELTGQL